MWDLVGNPEDRFSCKETHIFLDTTLTLGLQTGLLLAVPIPNEHEAEGKIIEAAIQTAVSKSQLVYHCFVK